MFKKNLATTKTNPLDEQLNSELIVHNMPVVAAASRPATGSTGGMNFQPGLAAPEPPRSNFKMVGALIMVGGLVVIAALVYFSYIFIIKPAAPSPAPAVGPAATAPAPLPATSSAPALVPPVAVTPPSQLATVTPSDLGLTASTSSSTAATSSPESNGSATSTSPMVYPDTDQDGLNNLEEAVLGTSATSSDTNNNGYPDLVEIMHDHNPIGTGPLSADANLATYTSATGTYSVIYPKDWPLEEVNDQTTVIFTAPDNSLIQISYQVDTNNADILTWYESLFPQATVSYSQVQNAATWDGIMGADNLNFYLADKAHKRILVFTYIPATPGAVAYPNIFKMMINSLVFK